MITVTEAQRNKIATAYNSGVKSDFRVTSHDVDEMIGSKALNILAKHGTYGIMLQADITIGGSPALITLTLADVTVNKQAVMDAWIALSDSENAMTEMKAIKGHSFFIETVPSDFTIDEG